MKKALFRAVCWALVLSLFPAWMMAAGDRYKMAYASREGGSLDVWVAELDASFNLLSKKRLTSAPAEEDTPIWSVDGKWIAYRSEVDGPPALWIMDADGNQKTKVFQGEFGYDLRPQFWSTDGKTIYGLYSNPGDGEVAMFDVATGQKTMLTSVSGLNTQSYGLDADRAKVAFVRGDQGNGWTNRLYTADFFSAGSDFINIQLLGAAVPSPHWPEISPAGDRIVFTIESPPQDANTGLGIINLDGTGFRVVIPQAGGRFIIDPIWIDEDHIIYSGESVSDIRLYLLDLATLERRPLTFFRSSQASVFAVRNSAPVAAAKDISLAADGSCQAMAAAADFDNGSSDPDGDELTFAISPQGPYPLGETQVTLTVTDANGASAEATALVTVYDETAPVPDLAALPTLTGQCSVEIPAAPTATDNCAGLIIGKTADPLSYAAQGTYIVTWVFEDGHGNASTQTQTVVVKDTVAPVIQAISASPDTLWSPNHKMVPVTIAVTATDACSAAVTSRIVAVESNEPEDGLGDGDTAPDWEFTGLLTLNLRAERSGTGDGRTYTIIVECKDANGNVTTGTATVTVPKNKGR